MQMAETISGEYCAKEVKVDEVVEIVFVDTQTMLGRIDWS